MIYYRIIQYRLRNVFLRNMIYLIRSPKKIALCVSMGHEIALNHQQLNLLNMFLQNMF
jgi:hypothetical protein